VSFSQEKLAGKYCSVPIGESDVACFNFEDNYRFDYEVLGCLGLSSFGTGSFEIIDENLLLIFDKKQQIIKSSIEIIESISKSQEAAEFIFDIKDENGFEIPIYIMRLSDSEYFRIDEITQNITVKKDSPTETYRISFIGYETIDLKLNSNTDKLIKINLIPVQPLQIFDKEIKLKLDDFNNNEVSINLNSLENKYIKVNE
jgi:hypothetical protein